MAVGSWITGFVFAALGASAGLFVFQRATERARFERAFENFIREYGRIYHTRDEWESRFQIFSANFKFIEAENRKSHSYVLGAYLLRSAKRPPGHQLWRRTSTNRTAPDSLAASPRPLPTSPQTQAVPGR
mmetsp:Transcript_6028/g.6468  ORF Transcript_6028/g.6468 Transcript_6028/m.6468 type:complete len:130 (+) Transcript_6028:120-509(+)